MVGHPRPAAACFVLILLSLYAEAEQKRKGISSTTYIVKPSPTDIDWWF